jgi:hypothetical protein
MSDPYTTSLNAKHALLAAIDALETLRPVAAQVELDIAAALDAMDVEQPPDELDPLGTIIDRLRAILLDGLRAGVFPPEP